jgi:hypothetical protein
MNNYTSQWPDHSPFAQAYIQGETLYFLPTPIGQGGYKWLRPHLAQAFFITLFSTPQGRECGIETKTETMV